MYHANESDIFHKIKIFQSDLNLSLAHMPPGNP